MLKYFSHYVTIMLDAVIQQFYFQNFAGVIIYLTLALWAWA